MSLDKNSAKKRSNGHDHIILGYHYYQRIRQKKSVLYLIHKRHKVKLNLHLELSYFLWQLADFDRTPRPFQAIYSYNINSGRTKITQFISQNDTALYLDYKKRYWKKLKWGGISPPPPDLWGLTFCLNLNYHEMTEKSDDKKNFL